MTVSAPVAVPGGGDPAGDYNALRDDVIAIDKRPSPLAVPPISGLWTATPLLSTLGQSNSTLDRLWLCPIYIREDANISEISFKPAITPSAGGIVRAGIWNAGTNRRPTGTPVQAVSVDTTGGAARYQTSLPANAAVTAPLFWLGLVQQVSACDLILAGVPNSGSNLWNFALDDGYLLEGDTSGLLIVDAYYLDSVSGALPDLTAASLTLAGEKLPRHAVRFA